MSRHRPRSPVTVEEWVAALPVVGTGGPEEDEEGEGRGDRIGIGRVEEEDTLSLGAEAVKGEDEGKGKRRRKHGRLEHSDTVTSTHSLLSCCSTEDILQAREPDPEHVIPHPYSSLLSLLPLLLLLLFHVSPCRFC